MPSQSALPTLNVQKTLTRARQAQRSGRLADAATIYLDVLSRCPRNPRARKAVSELGAGAIAELVQKAQACEKARNLNDAERCWTAAARLCPRDVAIGLSLARCRSDLGRHDAALDAINAVLDNAPANPTALNTKGNILRDLDQPDAAKQAYLKAMEQSSNPSSSLNNLGILAKAHGETKEAAKLFKEAISADPENVSLHFNLSGCQSYQPGDAHLDQMQHVLSKADKSDPAVAPLHFALFKALDDMDERETAFSHLLTGNRLRKSISEFNPKREAHRFAWFKSLMSGHETPPVYAEKATIRPIFIVGLPRSGTTLIERCLARVDGVRAGGELSMVSTAVAPLLRHLQTNQKPTLSGDDIRALRAVLLRQISNHARGASVLIDKMPLNFRWAGLICLALPEAKIISATRAPMPVAWSLFRHLFSSAGNGFAYDMGDIAAYSLLHRDLMRFWQHLFADQIIPVDYNSLVSAPETSLRHLLERCELCWTDKCLEPEAAHGQILTASTAQIKRGFYSGSDEAWQRYAPQLAPLHSALHALDMV